MKIIRIISRILIGCVFIFSGFVKAVDPLGSTYKFSDYFEAFHMGFFEPMSFILAIILSTTELVTGINLLIGIRMKLTSWILLIFMTGFTILTLIIAVTDPVEDCGCFGDALILTNWQTFWKNIILLVPTFIVVFNRKKYKPAYHCITEWKLLFSFILLSVLLSVFCYKNLPVLDFRPYKTGTDIRENMRFLNGAPMEESIIWYTLKNTETEKTVTITDKEYVGSREYWEEGSPWIIINSADPEIIKEGYIPPIHDFSLTATDGTDITNMMLSGREYTFLLISYDLMKASDKGLKKAVVLADSCRYYEYPFYCMTNSTQEEIDAIKEKFDPSFEFYTTDEITLKTIIRSNPGLVLLRNGIILRKWHYNNFPDPKKLDEYHIVQLKEKYRKRFNISVSVSFALGFLIALGIFHYFYIRKNKKE